jgi:hypothetical protein
MLQKSIFQMHCVLLMIPEVYQEECHRILQVLLEPIQVAPIVLQLGCTQTEIHQV